MENLWGEIPGDIDVRPPITILREQATLLGELTNKILLAEVGVNRQGGDLTMDLRIVAPALANYTYVVLTARHGIQMYPVQVINFSTFTPEKKRPIYECTNESELLATLKAILGAPHLHNVISSLMAQSKAQT